MTTEGRISRLEGAYEQVNERLGDYGDYGDYIERFADISRRIEGVREEIGALRNEMNANIAGVRRENRWISGIIIYLWHHRHRDQRHHSIAVMRRYGNMTHHARPVATIAR